MQAVVAARSAYALFQADCHARCKSGKSGLALGERMKAISEQWRSLDDETREEYEEKARDERARFERESAARDAAVLQAQAAKRAARDDDDFEPRRKRPEPRVEEKPKRPAPKREVTVDRERVALQQRAADQASRRLSYLLSQSDIFAHFGVAAEPEKKRKKKEEKLRKKMERERLRKELENLEKEETLVQKRLEEVKTVKENSTLLEPSQSLNGGADDFVAPTSAPPAAVAAAPEPQTFTPFGPPPPVDKTTPPGGRRPLGPPMDRVRYESLLF